MPQTVLCSDAARTIETAESVVSGAGADVPIAALPALYEAHVGDVVDAVRGLPAEVSRALVVGHEPTMSATVAALTGQYLRFPTSGVAVVEFTGGWRELEPDGCSLDRFRAPKDC